MPKPPLEGILVADFSRVLAGPLATMTLADLGARVIKVERPGTGDDTRHWGPPYSTTGTTYFDSVNRNKESVCLDLADPADLALGVELALRADVLVENFKPGEWTNWGLATRDLSARNPGLVYASISGFGDRCRRGPARVRLHRPGAWRPDEHHRARPSTARPRAGVALVDVLTAKDTAIGILAALNARSSDGRGAHLKMNLLSSLQGALANQAQAFLGAGQIPVRMGNEHPSIVPYQLLEAADGPVAIACGNDAQFAKLCQELGQPGLAVDWRFATNKDRVNHRGDLIPLLERALAHAPAAEWQQRLSAVGVPAGMVATIDQGLAYADSLGLEPTIDVRDVTGSIVGSQVRHPIMWDPPFSTRGEAPPRLGQNTTDVISWLSGAAAASRANPSGSLDVRAKK